MKGLIMPKLCRSCVYCVNDLKGKEKLPKDDDGSIIRQWAYADLRDRSWQTLWRCDNKLADEYQGLLNVHPDSGNIFKQVNRIACKFHIPKNYKARGKSEAAVARECDRVLKDKRIYFINTNGTSRVGHPDRIACIKGNFVSIEYKRPYGGVQSDMQKIIEAEIKKNLGEYHIVTSKEELTEVIGDRV